MERVVSFLSIVKFKVLGRLACIISPFLIIGGVIVALIFENWTEYVINKFSVDHALDRDILVVGDSILFRLQSTQASQICIQRKVI